jgi:hypothetical protein
MNIDSVWIALNVRPSVVEAFTGASKSISCSLQVDDVLVQVSL